MRPAVLENLPWRIAGLLLLGVLVVIYDPEQGGAIHRLAIPIAMAVATWMLVQNLAAVALGAGLLALFHSAPGSSDWIRGIAHPVLAGISALTLAGAMIARFRRHIAATHDARWRHRLDRQQDRGS